MATAFQAFADAATRVHLNTFGELSVTYTPASGSAIEVDVFFDRELRLQVEGNDGTTEIVTKAVKMIKGDLAGLDTKGSFLIGGVSYQIVEILEDDGERILFQVK